jgi:Tfp pilus assembly protein PilX
MFIHVQRESGLAHRTLVLRPWQVQALRVLSSKSFLVALALGLLSWGYFAVQAARVPLLTQRISHLEQDAQRLDTLQRTLSELQDRYGQVQRLLTASKAPAPTVDAPKSPKKTP